MPSIMDNKDVEGVSGENFVSESEGGGVGDGRKEPESNTIQIDAFTLKRADTERCKFKKVDL